MLEECPLVGLDLPACVLGSHAGCPVIRVDVLVMLSLGSSLQLITAVYRLEWMAKQSM